MAAPVNKPKRAYNRSLRQEHATSTRQRILEAARRLFVSRGYSPVTMADIARAAGVAYQTVYAVFGTKLGVARGIIWSSVDGEGVSDLLARATAANDPEDAIRAGARIARLIGERLNDLLRFMRESGDPELLAEYTQVEDRRFRQQRFVGTLLKESGRLKEGLSPDEAVDVIWAMSGTTLYDQLVSRRRWTAAQYEQWLGDVLTS